jgi:hypothetical protein
MSSRAIVLALHESPHSSPAAEVTETGLIARAGPNQANVQLFDVIRGLAAYRAGRFAEAAELIRTGLDRPRQLPYVRPAAQFVLAMTLHREGKNAEARVALAEARQSAARLTPGDDEHNTRP